MHPVPASKQSANQRVGGKQPVLLVVYVPQINLQLQAVYTGHSLQLQAVYTGHSLQLQAISTAQNLQLQTTSTTHILQLIRTSFKQQSVIQVWSLRNMPGSAVRRVSRHQSPELPNMSYH